MKKPINLLLSVQTILLITVSALLFSSCIIVGTDEDPEIVFKKKHTTKIVEESSEKKSKESEETDSSKQKPAAKYSITCRNQTNFIVTDWCVSKDNIVTYANSSFNRMIGPYKEDKIQNLPEGYYKVYFTFDDDYQLNPTNYLSSDSIQLNQDVIYTLFVKSTGYAVECRSADTFEAAEFYLQGSDGSIIELK